MGIRHADGPEQLTTAGGSAAAKAVRSHQVTGFK
jgi:hypothetical protein